MHQPYGAFNQRREPQIRLTHARDVNTLTQLDLKCYQYPWTLDDWKQMLKEVNDENRVIVVEVSRDVVGFAAYELVEDMNSGESYVEVTRLGVHPLHRRNGYGSMLLKNVEASARRMKADKLTILVPEIHCFPGDPDDVSLFLKHNGYSPSGAIAYGYKRMYGQDIDGYYFCKTVPPKEEKDAPLRL